MARCCLVLFVWRQLQQCRKIKFASWLFRLIAGNTAIKKSTIAIYWKVLKTFVTTWIVNQAFKVLVCLHSRPLGTASPEGKRRFSPVILSSGFSYEFENCLCLFPCNRNGNSDLQDGIRRRHCPLNYCWQQKSGKAMHVMKSRNVWRQERRAISQMLSANLLCFPFFRAQEYT